MTAQLPEVGAHEDLVGTQFKDIEERFQFPIVRPGSDFQTVEVLREEMPEGHCSNPGIDDSHYWDIFDPDYATSQARLHDQWGYDLEMQREQMDAVSVTNGKLFMEQPVIKATMDHLTEQFEQFRTRTEQFCLIRQCARNTRQNMTHGNTMKIKASEDILYHRHVILASLHCFFI